MSEPLEVLCCYAREDREMMMQLKKYLTPLEKLGQITIWSDIDVNAGEAWDQELQQHLESADIILLLLSPDFLAADYCYSAEMQRIMQRHAQGSATVIPIVLRVVHLTGMPFANLQRLPRAGRPINKWPDRDDVFHDILGELNQVIARIQMERLRAQMKRPAPPESS